jgi:hypothetical protein
VGEYPEPEYIEGEFEPEHILVQTALRRKWQCGSLDSWVFAQQWNLPRNQVE